MTTAELIAKVKAEGQFDTQGGNISDATILGWLNERYSEIAVKTRWFKGLVELGPTVAAQAWYSIPDNVLEILALSLAGGGEGVRTNVEGVWSLRAGTAALPAGKSFAYAPSFASTAETDQRVQLWPVPSETGTTIEGLCVLTPAALDAGNSPAVPDDVQGALVDGAIALGLRRTDGRADLAVSFEEAFTGAVVDLKRRAVSRVGQGPVQFATAGRHF